MKLALVALIFLIGGVSALELDGGLDMHHRTDYDVGHSGGGSDSSYFPQFHSRPESVHYVDLTYPDEGYHRRPHYHRPSYHHEPFPWHWFALAKALFWKLKVLGLIKLGIVLLFKVPVFLLLFALKLLFLLKLLKLAKLALALPFLIPLGLLLLVPLLPLLLAPLLLLPLLLPLLLLLPIPVLQQAANNNNNNNQPMPNPAGRAASTLGTLRSILEADQCIERIACRIAPHSTSPYASFITWVLDRMGSLIRHPKFQSYVEAYKSASMNRNGGRSCAEMYRCNSAYY